MSSITAQWTFNGNDAGIPYELDSSSASFLPGTIVSSVTYLSTATVGLGTALVADTTYQLQVSASEGGITSAYTPLGSTSTWTSALQNVVDVVSVTSVTVEWTAFTTGSGVGTAEGYRLEASTTNFNGTGTVYYSSTTDVTQSTLTVVGLGTNTTYTLRAGALNHNQVPNWTWFKTETTGAGAAPTNVQILKVYISSATLGWYAVPGASGYELDASSMDFASGVVQSSITYDASFSTLTVFGLTPNTTYWFKVGSLWNGATSYIVTHPSTSTWTSNLLNPLIYQVNYTSITVNWTPWVLGPEPTRPKAMSWIFPRWPAMFRCGPPRRRRTSSTAAP